LSEAYLLDSEADKRYYQYISEIKLEIDSALMRFLSFLGDSELQPQVRYSLTSGGKRLRPLLLVMSGQSVGGRREALIPPAVAIEFVHSASLIHDDILDFEKLRRGFPTLYEKLRDKSLIVGDMLFVLAVTILARNDPRVLEIIAERTLELCDGEFMDVSLSLDTCVEEDYFRKVKKKSASLFKAAGECGATIGGGFRADIENLSGFSELFGVAYQVKDDLEDVQSRVFSDFRNGRVTLPYLHLYANGDDETRQLLGENLGRDKVTDRVAKKILKKMDAVGSLHYCQSKIEEYKAEALNSLANIRDSEFKRYLIRFSQTVFAPEEPSVLKNSYLDS